MKKLKLLIGLFLLSICIAAVAAGCGSSSGTVVDKLPIDNNMPKPDGSETKPSVPPNTSGDGENSNGDMQEPPSPTEPNDPTEPSDPKPEPDVPPKTPPEEVENIVVFVAEGFEYTVPYSAENIAINEPAVPEKHGYRGKWQSYDLSQGGKITVRAEYELINYVITFTADKESFEITYTIFDSAVQPPQVPQRKGYNAVWEAFTLTYGEAITVNAIYTPIIYKIYFPVGSESILRTYTVTDSEIDVPDVPHKAGYVGEWRYGELTFGEDMYAEAVYTPLPATSDKLFDWKLNSTGNGYAVTAYNGTDSDVIIPSFYKGLPVTEVGTFAFSNDFCEKSLNSVIISENVTKIGNGAFTYCFELTEAELPSTLLEIEIEAFSYTAITEINLPQGLEKIGQKAFTFTKLKSIVIPDSVTDIGEFAFKGCEQLQSAVIRNGLKVIKQQTFWNCNALKTVEIGESVEQICKGAFDSCGALESAVFRDITYWHLFDGKNTSAIISEKLTDTAVAAKLLKNAISTEFIKSDS